MVEQRLFDTCTSEIRRLHVSVTRLEGTQKRIIPYDKDVADEQRRFLSNLLEREHALQCDLRRSLQRGRLRD